MLEAVAEILRRRRSEGWLVGGSLRDRELGRYSPDLDVVVPEDARGVARELAQSLDVPMFTLSERHRAYRVVGPDAYVDVAAMRGQSIVDDLGERDFTVNAMAMPVGGTELIDPFRGLSHLREQRLVAVSDRVFEDDPLRLMRAARLCHVLGFDPDSSLSEAMRAQAALLSRAAPERVVSEMALTFSAGRAAAGARLWSDMGLLQVILPELALLDRAEAAFALLERLDEAIGSPSIWFPTAGGLLEQRLTDPIDGTITRPVGLRFGALMHPLSPGQADAAARRLKLSSGMASLLRAVCRSFGAAPAPFSRHSPREAVLFLWEAAPWEPEVLLMWAASVSVPPSASGDGARVSALEPLQQLMTLWRERTLHGTPRLPVDGDLLMRELALDPGPLLGRALREARLACEAGEISTAHEAVAIARRAVGAEL